MTAHFPARRHLGLTRPAFADDPRRQCRDTDTEIFYSDNQVDAHTARSLCERCPVKQECGDWATQAGEVWGIWGGVNRNRNAARLRARKLRLREVAAA